MRKIILYLSIFYLSLTIYVSSCSYKHAEDLRPKNTTIDLRWVKAYENERWENVRIGLIWALSYLGATVPTGSFDRAIIKKDEYHFSIDFSKVGFSELALEKLQRLLTVIQESEEYKVKKGIDLGRFLMYTLHSSWHYYELTDVKPTLDEFKSQYFMEQPIEYFLSNSGIAKTQRLIRFSRPTTYQQLGFVGVEGTGNLEDQTFIPQTSETIDLMPNGQLRYGIYDKKGKLKTAADTLYTLGGKPGKCQWCHEKSLQPLFYPSTDLPHSISRSAFLQYISQGQLIIEDYRRGLHTDITYQNSQDHTNAELLYISFMEPSLERIAAEWEVSLEKATLKMAAFPTHTYPEFPFLGILYHRKWVDLVGPYQTVVVPESARELSEHEPDILGLSTH